MGKASPKKTAIINICIIPSKSVGNACVELSQSLKSDNTMFVLDGKSAFAHATVFMARFAESEVSNILVATEKVLKKVKGFACEHTGYFMTAGRYLEVSYRISKEFMDLHGLLVNNLKKYRANPNNPFEEAYFTPYTREQQKNVKETGYDLAYNLYRPHITLTRYKEDKTPKIFPTLGPAELSFRLKKICAYKADANGAVYEKIEEFIIK